MSPRLTAAWRRTFASAHGSRNFRLYLAGHLVSAVGTWMNFTAASWLVLRLSNGSGTALGVNAALMFGPMLFLGPWGGVLADRYDKRRILIATQSAFGVIALAMATVVATGVVTLDVVYALSVAAGVVVAIDMPTRQSFYVEMVGEDALTNAVSLNSAVFMFSRVLGPALAGLLIATVGLAACFLLDAVSYVAVLVALLAMRSGELHGQRRSTRERGHLMAGIRYVWSTDDLRRPLILMAIIFSLTLQWQVLVPLLAEVEFGAGPAEFGAMSAAAGVGAFVAAIVMANRDPRPGMRLLALCAVGVGLTMASVAFAPTLWVAALLMVPTGFSAMFFMIVGNTKLQLTSVPEARGRVMALYGVIFLGSTPIGSPITGWIGEHLGPRAGYLISGTIALTAGLVVLGLARRSAQTQSNAGVVA
ncbi:MAG: MFS transporter [Thermoleophilaceae bacterium]